MLWQYLCPPPGGNRWFEYIALLSIGIVGALLVAMVFGMSIVVGAEQWLRTLPHPDVLFGKMPEMYRE